MINILRTVSLFIILQVTGGFAGGQDSLRSYKEETRGVRWHMQFKESLAGVEDEPSLPRVLLIGASNSIGYTLPARELLKGKANFHRIPMNGGPTTRGLKHLDQWLGTGKWDIIHFNWGGHDLKILEDGTHLVPIEQYEKNLRRLVERFEATGALLIWASTTPVPEGKLKPPRKNEDVIAYNAAAERVMEENGVLINDLYSVAFPRLSELQLPQNVHFTRHGYKVLGEAVASFIEHVLEKKRQSRK
ncbi:MAG: SGNH/GDSL hydrolase family protein [Gemmatimonadota bacterium]|nr:SGNH/GDSL hydrolase family protein [Gemmatimonadota bacterium]